MKIKMELLSDVIFGNGMSVPGGEDVSVLRDSYGFPYYKGGTFKGIFREEFIRYLGWIKKDDEKTEEWLQEKVQRLLGESGSDSDKTGEKLIFSDFCISEFVKSEVLKEIGDNNPNEVLDAFTHLRAFTRITEDGIAEDNTLRICRCVNKGLYFYSEISCDPVDEPMIKNVLLQIKWVGSMRNRGFGKVRITVVE